MIQGVYRQESKKFCWEKRRIRKISWKRWHLNYYLGEKKGVNEEKEQGDGLQIGDMCVRNEEWDCESCMGAWLGLNVKVLWCQTKSMWLSSVGHGELPLKSSGFKSLMFCVPPEGQDLRFFISVPSFPPMKYWLHFSKVERGPGTKIIEVRRN